MLNVFRVKRLGVWACVGMVIGFVGCTHAPVTGVLFTSVKSAKAVTAQPAGTRMGESCASSILGLIATGDAGVDAARKAGGITAIHSVDVADTSILGIYASHCTIVHGK